MIILVKSKQCPEELSCYDRDIINKIFWPDKASAKPLNSGHIGDGTFGLFSVVGPFSKVLL